MKKLIIVTLLVIIIPFLFVKIFVQTDEIKFKYVTNNTIRVKNEKTGQITKIPFEEYIKGVVAGEMPATFELEAQSSSCCFKLCTVPNDCNKKQRI